MTSITRGIATFAALCLGLGTASLAGAGDTRKMSGQVTGTQGDQLTIQSTGGQSQAVKMTEQTMIRGPQGTLGRNDIDRGDRVQVTAMQDPQGQTVATEIRVESAGAGGAGAGPGAGAAPDAGRQPLPTEDPEQGAPGAME